MPHSDQKICHLTSAHAHNDTRIFLKESCSLYEAGYDVSLVVPHDKDEIIDGIKILGIPTPKNRRERILQTTKQVYKRALECDADIYHFHDPELMPMGLRLKRKGKKVIYDVHEDVPRQILVKEWMPLAMRRMLPGLVELYENRCARKYDAIIVPTPHLKERFQKLNKSVWEVCNFPSTKDLKYSGENYSITNPGCYVGGLSNTRGIRQIAEATNKVGLSLNLCGIFQSIGLKEEVLSKFDNVEYLGFLGRTDISGILCNSSMGFVTLLDTPNDSMSYPIKLFEYMAAGIPVISSDFPVYRNIVEGYNCGICVDPLDIDAICSAINEIRNNKEYSDELRKNGRKAITEKFNWDTQAIKLIECYQSVSK